MESFARDLKQHRSAKISLNKTVMVYFADPEHRSFKTCSKRYWSVCWTLEVGRKGIKRRKDRRMGRVKQWMANSGIRFVGESGVACSTQKNGNK